MAEERYMGRRRVSEESQIKAGKNYLLAIGIDSYHHCTILKNAVKDARDLTETLLESYGFLPENISLVTNEDATEFRIFSEFRKLIQKVKPEDNVLIFFSGHGHYDDDFRQGYWIPVDARQGAIGDYIPNSEISTTIRAIPSRHTFMIADACFSGSLFGEGRSVRGQTPAYLQKIGVMPSRWGLASGRNEVVSDGVPGENSPFSQSLIYYLQTNRDRPFAVSELVQYVKTTTANNAEQTPIGSPLRNVGDKGGEFIFFPKVSQEQDLMTQASYMPQTVLQDYHAETRASEDISQPPARISNRILNWISEERQLLTLIVLSTVFWGLWASWLFLVVPLTCLTILLVTEIYDLKGAPKYFFAIGLTLAVAINFLLVMENDALSSGNILEEGIKRSANNQFLWASLGTLSSIGFLYFLLREKE